MAKNTQLSDASANAACNAVVARANSGSMKIYTGTQPANGNTAVGSQTLLATIALGSTAFASAVGGAATMNTTLATSIVATGTAAWFRIVASDGVTQVIDGSIGVTGSGSNIELGSTAFSTGAQVAITGYVYSIAEAGS